MQDDGRFLYVAIRWKQIIETDNFECYKMTNWIKMNIMFD